VVVVRAVDVSGAAAAAADLGISGCHSGYAICRVLPGGNKQTKRQCHDASLALSLLYLILII